MSGFKCLGFGVKPNLCFPQHDIQYKGFDSQGENWVRGFWKSVLTHQGKLQSLQHRTWARHSSLSIGLHDLGPPLNREIFSLPGSACGGRRPKKAQSVGLHCQVTVCPSLLARLDSPSVYTTNSQATPETFQAWKASLGVREEDIHVSEKLRIMRTIRVVPYFGLVTTLARFHL